MTTSVRFKSFVYWLAFYAVLWLLLAEGSGWYLGVFLVPAAAGLTVRLGLHLPRVQWRHAPGFIIFFVREVVVGGWDVARRAFSPRLPVSPRWMHYTFTVTNPRIRLAVSACIGLMPGTLSSGVVGDGMKVHVLDDQHDWATAIQQLETHLALLFPGDRS